MAILERATPDAPAQPLPVRRSRFFIGIGLSVTSGLLAVWSLEDFHVELLAWFAWVPAIVATYRVLPRRWSGIGLGIAVGVMFQGYLGPGLSNAALPWYFYVYRRRALRLLRRLAGLAVRSRGGRVRAPRRPEALGGAVRSEVNCA
ncbi:MAG: hypothetical protein WD826_05195 [Actinomycetota bacterium]